MKRLKPWAWQWRTRMGHGERTFACWKWGRVIFDRNPEGWPGDSLRLLTRRWSIELCRSRR